MLVPSLPIQRRNLKFQQQTYFPTLPIPNKQSLPFPACYTWNISKSESRFAHMCIWQQMYCRNCQFHFLPRETTICPWKYRNFEKCVKRVERRVVARCYMCAAQRSKSSLTKVVASAMARKSDREYLEGRRRREVSLRSCFLHSLSSNSNLGTCSER